MKKFIFLALIFLASFLYAEIPSSLYGIWEGKDRYVFFERDEDETDQIVIILKTYYGWYLDRAAEAEKYSSMVERTRNTATAKKSVYVISDVDKIKYENENSGAYELKLTYAKRDITYVPLCLIDGRIYLDFFVKDEIHPEFWAGNVKTEGITISNQIEKEYLYSWLINLNEGGEGDIFKIRYWKTNMEYSAESEATIRKGGVEYKIPKHIVSAQNVYTCVPGKRVVVRNLDERQELFDGHKFMYNSEENLCALDEPYLQILLDKESFEDLMDIVKTQNSKRKPDPPPLFPPSNIDFHWDLIDYLERDNEIIKGVRERQKKFGIRGKDIGK